MAHKILLLFSFLIFSVFLIGSVNAQPPFQQPTRFTEGYEIQIPPFETLEQNQNFTFAFHIYNISNGVPIDNSTTDCSFHLFDNRGSHLFVDNNMNHTEANGVVNDWESKVLGGNFSRVGNYAYLVQCNSTVDNLGGFASVTLRVTPTGEHIDIQQSVLAFGLILILLFLTWVFFFFGNEVRELSVKIFLIAMGSLFLMFTIGVSINIIEKLMLVSSVFSGTFVGLYRLILGLISVGFMGILLYLITFVLKAFHKSRGVADDDDDD